MGTITTTQAGHTYKVVQSNIGIRVEYFDGSDFVEILIHRPDETAPVDPVPPSDVTAPVVRIKRVGTDLIVYAATEPGTAFWLVNDRPEALTGSFIASAGNAFPVTITGTAEQTLDLSGLARGVHYMHLTVRDAAGNFSIDVPQVFETAW